MNGFLLGVVCGLSLAGTALGQAAINFGSRTGGLGNAGGFATGSGFSNGSAESLFFGRSAAGAGFGNMGGLYTGGNAIYNYGAYGFNTGNASWGNNNIGALNALGLAAPGLGLGTGGLGIGGPDTMTASGMGWGGPGWYSGGLGLGGGLPVTGIDSTGLGFGVPGMQSGQYGAPLTGYGLPSPTVANATSNRAPTRNRPAENFTNNAMPNRADALAAGVPIATANALRIQERLARSASRANFGDIKVLMSGRTAVLQGRVDSQADEQLVQRLISLEPSVDGVISQLDYPGKARTTPVPAR